MYYSRCGEGKLDLHQNTIPILRIITLRSFFR